MTTLTHSTGSLMVFVNGYEATREARTIVHPILNRSEPDITLRPAGLRTGTLTLLIAEQADAVSAFGILSVPQVFTITDPDTPAIDMSFVTPEGGTIGIALDPETQDAWILTVPFAEVSP